MSFRLTTWSLGFILLFLFFVFRSCLGVNHHGVKDLASHRMKFARVVCVVVLRKVKHQRLVLAGTCLDDGANGKSRFYRRIPNVIVATTLSPHNVLTQSALVWHCLFRVVVKANTVACRLVAQVRSNLSKIFRKLQPTVQENGLFHVRPHVAV